MEDPEPKGRRATRSDTRRAERVSRAKPMSSRVAATAVALGILGISSPGGDAVAVTAPARIHLSARPSVAKVAERTRFVFVATRGTGASRRAVPGAVVMFAGSRARTDRRGRAVIVHRFADD